MAFAYQDGGEPSSISTAELSRRGMGELSVLCWVVCCFC